MALLLNAGDTVSRSYSYTQPSPLHPSQPNGTGDRTGNLFDKNATDVNNGYISGYYLYPDGTPVQPSSSLVWNTSEYIEITSGTIALSTLSTTSSGTPAICFYDSSKNYIIGYSYDNGKVRVHTVPNGAKYCRISIDERVINQLMLNSGSTPLPYEPYGQYKIPISSASTTTPVYLGEVQTTRKIRKYEFTGQENWNYATSSQAHWIENVPNDYNNTLYSQITTVCTHYRCIGNDTGLSGMVNGDLRLYAKATSPIAHELYIKDETYTSAADFKAYLAAQYAAGTPVTVWYVLATPTTGVVNEPLMKIGDYADEVSGISIPVTAGANTLSVDTTVQPSEVTVNYKGWHPVADVHERDSGAWT